MRFQVDDLVRIAKDSEYYTDETRNPKDTVGTISDIGQWGDSSEDHQIHVLWFNGHANSYRESDLKLRRRR